MRRKLYIVLGILGIVGLALVYSLVPCFSIHEKILCQGPADHPWIALTFDDGPNEPYTSAILDILKDEQITATFFIVGKYAAEYPETVQRIAREGHAIGNHTMTHEPLVFKGKAAIENDIDQWEETINAVSPKPLELKLFRSPHGWKSPFLSVVLRQKGYRLIGWTHGVWDSDQPGKDVLLERLRRAGENGAIILLHDGDGDRARADRSQTVHALKEIIPYYRSRGFRFVTIPEILN